MEENKTSRTIDFTPLAQQLTNLCEEAIAKQIFPGAAAAISFGPPKKREQLLLSCGYKSYHSSTKKAPPIDPETIFDLASLTKPFATLLAILCLLKSKKLSLNDQLGRLLNHTSHSPYRGTTIGQLLCHRSGLPAHQPYFIELMKLPLSKRKSALTTLISQEKMQSRPGTKTVYSDLGFMLLGHIAEKVSGATLNNFVEQNILKPLNLEQQIFFNPGNNPRPLSYAPTEVCPWREKLLEGQAHDDNCYALGGVAGHAGLFGNIKGVLKIATHLLDNWHDRTLHPGYNNAELKRATKMQYPGSTWAAGFDTPSPVNSSAGHYLSQQSFGHLGFTGTSFWIDPIKNLVIVLLTNRVHPRRDNTLIKEFRPLFHDTVGLWLTNNKFI